MKKNLLLLALIGVALIVIGGFLIQSDTGSCPAQTTNSPIQTPHTCYHLLFGFLPMSPTGWLLIVIGIILIMRSVLFDYIVSKEKRKR
jgi:hypothetical protein